MGGEPGVPGCPLPEVTSDACARPRRPPGPAFPQVPRVFRPARQAGRLPLHPGAGCRPLPGPCSCLALTLPLTETASFQTRPKSHPAVPRSCLGLPAACGLALPSPSLTLRVCPLLCLNAGSLWECFITRGWGMGGPLQGLIQHLLMMVTTGAGTELPELLLLCYLSSQ